MGQDQPKQGGGLPIGSKIGKYEIREKVGVGGQAIVYKCYDSSLDRYVAIKQIATHFAEDPRFVDRFRKEAQILARLGAEQPAIIAIHELIENADGLFIVMEFVEGHTLESILAETDGPVDAKIALQIIWRLAAGLHAVHDAGIIHRDIKPGNIIVSEGTKPKITDFGVAASTSGQTSMLLGTTKYMAPEVFEGPPHDARADMYSLGFIAYEMLAGRQRFNEVFAEVVRDKHSESLRWMKWHGNAKVTAPRLDEINPEVGPAMADIVAKMMAKNRQERYESMESLGRAIKQSFFPRSKGAVMIPREQQPQAGGPKQAPVAALAAGSVVASDELDVSAEAPATLPLPKKQLSVRARTILGCICAVSIVFIGIVLGYQWSQAKTHRVSTAEAIYTEALDAYNKGSYAEAAERFEEVEKRFAGTTRAIRASVKVHLARAHISVVQNEWTSAKEQESTARDKARKTQARYGSMEDWTRAVLEEIANFSQYRINTQIFVEAMDKAQAALSAGDFQQARSVLSRPEVATTEKQESRRQKLLNEVDVREFAAQVESVLARGDGLAEQGKFVEAIESFKEAQKQLSASNAKMLPEQLHKEISDKAATSLQKAIADQGYDRAIKNYAAAAETGEQQRQLDALLVAAKFHPSDEKLDKQIRQLRSKIDLQRARQMLAKGDLKGAQALVERARAQTPKDAAVIAMQKELKSAFRSREITDQADDLYASGNYSAALAKYEQAEKLRGDARVAAKITDCRFMIGLTAGDALRDDKKHAEAAEVYESLREIKPNETVRIDARLENLQARKVYDEEIAKGDASLAKHRWSEALKYFRKAKGLRQTDEVEERITGTRYRENLATGKSAMDSGDLPGALAYFKIAKGFLETEEVNDLIEQVERKLEE